MRKIVIFGTSPFAKLMKWYIENDSDDAIVCFTVEKAYMNETEFCGLPVVAFEELDTICKKDEVEILVTVGYRKMNQIREQIFKKCEDAGYKIASFIHSTVVNYADSVGYGNIILEEVKLQPFCSVGNGNIIQHFTIISHEAQVGDFNYFAGNVHIAGLSSVAHHCFVGINGLVQNTIKLAPYTMVGATACVNANTEEGTVITPSKNRVIKTSVKAMDMFLR